MEQQMDAFSQKRFELMMEMATKKMQQEMAALKEQIHSLTNELGSLKNQVHRIQFSPPQERTVHHVQAAPQAVGEQPYYQPEAQQPQVQQRQEVKIVDCRSSDEKKTEFVSGAAKNSQEPIRPRFGDYKSQDVSIDKFFYFGRK
jgi:ElaB/YqjD/DUF883 family membrane-anchored ribosome-binding protein